MRPATLISAAVKAAREAGLVVARVTYEHETGRVVVETPLAASENAPKLEQVDWSR